MTAMSIMAEMPPIAQMDRDCFLLTDARIEPHLPTDTPGKPRVDDRRVIGGYRLLSGGTLREKAFRERWKGHRNKRRGDGPRIEQRE